MYLRHEGNVTVSLDPGKYEINWFNPRIGEYFGAPIASDLVWRSAFVDDEGERAILIKRYPMQLKPYPKETIERVGAVLSGGPSSR